MKRHFLSLVGLLTAMAALASCASISKTDRCVQELGAALMATELGTEIRDIEKSLSLGKPVKTYMGSSSYHDRLFRYYGVNGCMVEIGLRQVSEENRYDSGTFEFNGDFTVVGDSETWNRCCHFNDWAESYRGPNPKW